MPARRTRIATTRGATTIRAPDTSSITRATTASGTASVTVTMEPASGIGTHNNGGPDPAPCAPGTYSSDGKNAGGDKACTECKPGESFDRRWCVDLCRKLPCRKLQYILRCGQGQIYMQIYMCALHLAHMDVSVINLIYMHVGHLCICYTQIHTCECTCIHVSVSCMHACINTCMQT